MFNIDDRKIEKETTQHQIVELNNKDLRIANLEVKMFKKRYSIFITSKLCFDDC